MLQQPHAALCAQQHVPGRHLPSTLPSNTFKPACEGCCHPAQPLPAVLQTDWVVLCWQVGKVKEGELFRVETIDWTGGQIKDDDSADDVKNIDLTQAR